MKTVHEKYYLVDPAHPLPKLSDEAKDAAAKIGAEFGVSRGQAILIARAALAAQNGGAK